MFIVASTVLIVIGLVLSVVGEGIIIEGFSQKSGGVGSEETLLVSVELDSQDTATGIFAVQIPEFKDNTFFAEVSGPFGSQIVSQRITSKTIEEKFDVFETGEYRLAIKSNDSKELTVFATIGPLPDANKLLLRPVSMIMLVIGMAGLAIAGVYGIVRRMRSV